MKKMTRTQLVKRIKGRMKIVSKARGYPYTKWITSTKHVKVTHRGAFLLDTKVSKRYNDLKFMNRKELIFILRRIK